MPRKSPRIKRVSKGGVRRGKDGPRIKGPKSGGVYMFATQKSGKSFTTMGGGSGNLVFKKLGGRK